jgi:hypothetical protein
MRSSDFKRLNLIASSPSFSGIKDCAKQYLFSEIELRQDGEEHRVVNKKGKDCGLIIKLVAKRWQMRSERCRSCL